MRAFIEQYHVVGLALQVLIMLGVFAVVWIAVKQGCKIYRNMEGLRQRNVQARHAAIRAIPVVRTGECIEPFLARSVAPAWVNVLLMACMCLVVVGLLANLMLEGV
jgi:hypothetical protein